MSSLQIAGYTCTIKTCTIKTDNDTDNIIHILRKKFATHTSIKRN